MTEKQKPEGADRPTGWEQATAATHELLEKDAGNTRPLVRRVIRKLAECLLQPMFQPALNVTLLLGKCGLTRSAVTIPFRIDTRQSLSTYIKMTYLEIALGFLFHTKGKLEVIGELAGFSNYRQFKNTIEKVLGISAQEFELRAKLVEERSALPEVAIHSRCLWRDLRKGETERAQVLDIWGRLEWLYPKVARSWRRDFASTESVEEALIEQALMEAFWELLPTLPQADWQSLLKRSSGCGSASFFHFLCGKSLEAGREAPARGVEVMAMALGFLRAGAKNLGREFPALEALGLARLGNAHFLASDIESAWRVVADARELWENVENKDDLIEAEIATQHARLLLSQGELGASREVLDTAIDLCEDKPRCRLHAQCLIQRATVLGYAGDPEAAISDLGSALEVLAHQVEPRLKLAAHSNLAMFRALAGRFSEAEESLAEALERCADLNDRAIRQHLYWAQGLIDYGRAEFDRAAVTYQAAIKGFGALGQPGYVAVVALDLAVVRYEQGRSEEVADLAAMAIPVLEHFKHASGVTTALKMLNEAVARQRVPGKVLEMVRQRLYALWREPTANLEAVKA